MEETIEQALQHGVAAHKAGNLKEAEVAYRSILNIQQNNPDANHNLGLIAISANQIETALPLFKTALDVNPNIEQFWMSYIDALVKNNRLEDATQTIKKAKKKGFEVKKLQALLSQSKSVSDLNVPSQAQLDSLLEHYKQGRFNDAEKIATAISQEYPNHHFAWKVLGAIFGKTGRELEALHAKQTAVELSPQDAEAYYNLGNTLIELGRLDDAKASYNQAIALKPDHAEAHYNLGNTLLELGRLEDAEDSYNQAIALKPDHAEAHSNLGDVYIGIGKHIKAVECFEKVLELSSEDSLGATLKLASLGKREIPNKTPEKYMQDFYRRKSNKWDASQNNQSKYRGHLLIEDAFKKTHDLNKQLDILDLGCGTGSFASTLRPYAKTLIGVDLSADMLLKAEKKCLYDSLYQKDINHYLEKITNHFDTVVAAAVLIHFLDLDNIFFLVKNSLKINGKFVFSIFEGTQKSKDLNSFFLYSHNSEYIASLAHRQKLKIIYKQKDIHEYHKEIPIPAIIYVLEKIS